MFRCLSPIAYLNRFELLSLLRMKVFFPFKLQIDLIFISFIQDARRNDAMKNKERYFLYLHLFLFFCCMRPKQPLMVTLHRTQSQSLIHYYYDKGLYNSKYICFAFISLLHCLLYSFKNSCQHHILIFSCHYFKLSQHQLITIFYQICCKYHN